MNDQHFSLQPFSPGSPLPEERTHFTLTGTLARQSNILAICYTLCGPLGELMLPAIAPHPTRQHDLWKTTCFEFFLAIQDTPQYWEFNFSPAGHWNVYRFDGYRQGMQEELAWTTLPVSLEYQAQSFGLTLELDLSPIISPDRSLEIAISTIIQLREGGITYWALIHPGSQADFHRRDSFIIRC